MCDSMGTYEKTLPKVTGRPQATNNTPLVPGNWNTEQNLGMYVRRLFEQSNVEAILCLSGFRDDNQTGSFRLYLRSIIGCSG